MRFKRHRRIDRPYLELSAEEVGPFPTCLVFFSFQPIAIWWGRGEVIRFRACIFICKRTLDSL